MFQSKRLQRLGLSAASFKAYLLGWQSPDEKETETWRAGEGGGAVTHTVIGSFSFLLVLWETKWGDFSGGMLHVTDTWVVTLKRKSSFWTDLDLLSPARVYGPLITTLHHHIERFIYRDKTDKQQVTGVYGVSEHMLVLWKSQASANQNQVYCQVGSHILGIWLDVMVHT